MPRQKTESVPPPALRDACILAAQEVIAERGIEHLSLREVARKLGVSHQAPYKHYPSRDHLLAEVMRRCFRDFAAFLDGRELFEDPARDLASLGERYLRYAQERPLEYRLMFSTTWPAAAEALDLARDARHAFDILRGVLRRLHGDSATGRDAVELDALYVWSTVHGLAGVMSGPCVGELGLKAAVLRRAVRHAMDRVEAGLAGKR